MKNQLDFNIQFSNLWCHSFPNCFAGVYVYLEKIYGDLPKKCHGGESMCFGCACLDDADPQSVYFVLFDTLCGRSALHLRLDEKPTEMTALIGDGNGAGGWSGKCGTDYTIDFLFGFAGYEYRKFTDAAMFKDEIIASIGSDKPVLAELAADGSFCVITGYDGDTPLSSYYSTDQGNNTQEKRTVTLSYDAIKAIYIIGGKTAPRYTLKDGLERIKRVFKNNINDKIWDDGIGEITDMIITPTDDEFGKTNPDEINALKSRITKTITNQFNSHTFEVGFCHLPKIYDKERYPALSDLWGKLCDYQGRLGWYAHTAGHFNGIDISRIGLFRTGFGKMFVSAIEDIRNIHVEMFEIINQAIKILENE